MYIFVPISRWRLVAPEIGCRCTLACPSNLVRQRIPPIQGGQVRIHRCHLFTDISCTLQGRPHGYSPCRAGGVLPRVHKAVTHHKDVQGNWTMEQVRMAQLGSAAARHIPHQILHQHCYTRLFIRGSYHFPPDRGDAMVGGHSTDHAKVKDSELGKGGLGGNRRPHWQ